MNTIIANGFVINVTTDRYGRITETKPVKAKSSGFKPVINLWSKGIQEAILAGDLVLQKGQYVRCGEGGALSRYIDHNPNSGSFNVVHGGTTKQVYQRFKSSVGADKLAKMRGNMSHAEWARKFLELCGE